MHPQQAPGKERAFCRRIGDAQDDGSAAAAAVRARISEEIPLPLKTQSKGGCQAGLASSFGLRFQGQGYFLTDARTHRGGSGAPVVLRIADPPAECALLPWRLLGVHSARLDMLTRDTDVDEALGLNCAWYADILMTLTEAPARSTDPAA